MRHADERHCPALKSKCNKCHKKRHWERKCHSKAVREVTSEKHVQSHFLGAMNRNDNENKWTVGLHMNNVTVNFKTDTGADVTVIDKWTLNKLSPKIKLKSPDTRFVSPGGDPRGGSTPSICM